MLQGGYWVTLVLICSFLFRLGQCAEIFMITMLGAPSHKIPFVELGKSLHLRGHNITFVSAFPPVTPIEGIHEINPSRMVLYVRKHASLDLISSRMQGEEPLSLYETSRYVCQVCEAFYGDSEIKQLIKKDVKFELIVIDSAFTECALGLVHHYNVPFINTISYHMEYVSMAGNPIPWSVSPAFALPFSDDMNLVQRLQNVAVHLVLKIGHALTIKIFVQNIVRKHLGPQVPDLTELAANVLWRWEEDKMTDLPPNVKLGRWFPQQDLLGHPKIRAFVTHGGLSSILESVYHGVPMVILPVYSDQIPNSMKAELDGYAIRIQLAQLTKELLQQAILSVSQNPKYKEIVRRKGIILRDNPVPPLQVAVHWTEYVLRHGGAHHLMTPARHLSFAQYYLLDVLAIYFVIAVMSFYSLKFICKLLIKPFQIQTRCLMSHNLNGKIKVS